MTVPVHRGRRSAPAFVSVVIPVRNEAALLPAQLTALAAQDYDGDWEVVVSDNGSADGSAGVARGFADRLPSLVVVDSSATPGASHARNVGADAAQGDFLCFCDADDEAEPGWLAAMARVAEQLDMVGGRLDEERLNPSDIRLWRPKAQPHDELPVAHFFLPYAISANVGIWADVFAELGQWNEDLRVCEDIELSWRAQLAGLRVGIATDAVIAYRYRMDLRGNFRQYANAGFADTELYRRYRRSGMHRSSTRKAVREWAWLVWNIPDTLWSHRRRGIWMRKAGQGWGRLRGSVRNRVLFL